MRFEETSNRELAIRFDEQQHRHHHHYHQQQQQQEQSQRRETKETSIEDDTSTIQHMTRHAVDPIYSEKERRNVEVGNDRSVSTGSTRLPDWDPKAVERPIENEEWIAFLQRSMEEVMEGEVGSLLQQNCVSVFVSPLRNPAAGCRVVEYVACLLSLPFVISLTKDTLERIAQVYLDVRVVPNLVYALKLLMSERLESETNKKAEPTNANTRLASTLSADELQTLEYTMLVLCRLTYSRQQFLTQFCDAVYIVNGVRLLQQLLNLEKRKGRVVADLVAILTNILRSQPENAHLVEKVVFHSYPSGKLMKFCNTSPHCCCCFG